ncbi:MAG: histidine phosphatase family protein [Anaerolineae bacterium]|nr:histidine phosphatase family protein [Anaerolineae bacterium]MDW8172648.1 histidine phosphatase family protein [Anaerolineae bacterium]
MRVYLIRHAQSTNNVLQDVRDRVVDPDLTPLGYEQAETLASWLARATELKGEPFGFTRLLVSPMWRALLTAQPLARAYSLPMHVEIDLHEVGGMFLEDRDTGIITGYGGLTRSTMLERFDNLHLPDSVTEQGWWNPQMGMESYAHGIMRAVRTAHRIVQMAQDHPHERLALVTHGAFMDLLVKAFLHQLPTPETTLFYAHYNTAITRLDLREGDGLRVHYLNRVDHLPLDKRSW